ncbi:MAG: hypothetical protein U5L01_17405 [Rheinheimera sp.]|nr:hypothetical protein [Rheinheimera sp.]
MVAEAAISALLGALETTEAHVHGYKPVLLPVQLQWWLSADTLEISPFTEFLFKVYRVVLVWVKEVDVRDYVSFSERHVSRFDG